MRLHPSVKLKIDMLRTSIGSGLGARRREVLRSVLLRLFSRNLAFIVILYVPNANRSAACYDQAVVGFFDPSLEGENKSGNVTR